MSLTSFKNDPARIKKEMEIYTYEGRYQLATPGPGMDLPFIEDPQIRLQYWGANLRTNTIGIENELTGRNDILNRHLTDKKQVKVESQPLKFKSENPYVLESRSEIPAWTFRGIDNNYSRWENPLINPQANLEKEFNDNIQTRLVEKKIVTYQHLDDWSSWLPKF